MAHQAAETPSISCYIADVFPVEKAEVVRSLQADEPKVAIVDDGIRDAPVLAQANVDTAVHDETDVA